VIQSLTLYVFWDGQLEQKHRAYLKSIFILNQRHLFTLINLFETAMLFCLYSYNITYIYNVYLYVEQCYVNPVVLMLLL